MHTSAAGCAHFSLLKEGSDKASDVTLTCLASADEAVFFRLITEAMFPVAADDREDTVCRTI